MNFTLNRGDRVALVGVNGAGKSTLIKLLSGVEPVSAGEFRLGHNVRADYFAQDQYKALDPNARLLDDLASVAPAADSHQTRLRSLLGSFLFSDDDVFKRIGVLSGGERNGYALARMLLRPANFLLLDEPTNHLDLQAKDVLLEALQKFTGTVVFVSHDRYFIDKLATRIFEIENGEFQDYPGNYEDYLWQKERRGMDPLSYSSNGGFHAERSAAESNGTECHSVRLPRLSRRSIRSCFARWRRSAANWKRTSRGASRKLPLMMWSWPISRAPKRVYPSGCASYRAPHTTSCAMMKRWEEISSSLALHR